MDTRAHILAIALEAVNREGAGAIVVRDIAREAGIAPGNLSYHFPRKEDLLTALLAQHASGNDAFFNGLQDPDLDPDRMLELFRQSFQQQYGYRGLLLDVLVLGRLLGKAFDYSAVRKRRLVRLEEALDRLQANGHLQATASEKHLLRDLIAQNTRFWMHDALGTYGDIRPKRDIPRMLKRLRGLLSLYAPEKRKAMRRPVQRAQRTQ